MISSDSRIITQSASMLGLLSRVGTIAAADGPVLLVGETGVGKELFADYVHRRSTRRGGPFVAVSLSAIPHELLESEIFGHERGAYTSALDAKPGLFELARGGSIFLDDIDDVPPAVQAKLLRVLESHEVMRVGGTRTITVDVRLIAASKVDLHEWVRQNLFRADLYYRISVFPVEIPPLRARREDIPALVKHYLSRFFPHRGLEVTPEAMHALMATHWPGNVRELRNVVQRVTLFAGERIDLPDLPPEFHDGPPIERLARECTRCMVENGMTLPDVVTCLEMRLVRHALDRAAGNRSAAARILGLNLSTLRDKIHKYGLHRRSPQTLWRCWSRSSRWDPGRSSWVPSSRTTIRRRPSRKCSSSGARGARSRGGPSWPPPRTCRRPPPESSRSRGRPPSRCPRPERSTWRCVRPLARVGKGRASGPGSAQTTSRHRTGATSRVGLNGRWSPFGQISRCTWSRAWVVRGGLLKSGPMTEEQPPRSVPAKTFLATRTTAEGAVVEFGLEQAAQVTMVVYDVSGRLVRELVRASFEQGVYQRAWDGRGSSGRAVGAGVYFVQLRTGTKTLVQKLVMAH